MIRKRIYLLPVLVVMCLVWLSCKQERAICFEPKTPVFRIGAYQAAEGDTGIVITDSSLPNAVIISLDTPRAQVNATSPSNKFNLLLSPHMDSTRFIILADSVQILTPALYDTVVFYYERKLHFLSVACGYTYFFNLQKARTTNNYIDSVVITNTGVNNAANIEHVKVFF